MDLASIWEEYGLDQLQEGMDQLFNGRHISLDSVLTRIMTGDFKGAVTELFSGDGLGIFSQIGKMKDVFIWLVILGIVSALFHHFMDIFEWHQIADLSFSFVYLFMMTLLLKCFWEAAETATHTLENILVFVKLLFPTYLLAVGMATGSLTAGAGYQLLLLLLYGVEKIFLGVVFPFILSYAMLAVLNGIWAEEKLTLMMDLLEKGIGWILKAAIGVVTGFGFLQKTVAPVVDSAKHSVLQKAVAVIPGIGGAADGVMDLFWGSAAVIKNSVGVVLMLLLLLLCAAPLLQIFAVAFVLKLSAAFMGVVSDKRIAALADRTGDAGMLLLRMAVTAMLLFFVMIAVVATASVRRF